VNDPTPGTRHNSAAAGGFGPPPPSKWLRWRQQGMALAKYLLDSEVHTFAFSVAANAILSFIPFIVLLYTLAQSVFHSPAMSAAITDMVKYFLPSNQPFIANTLSNVAWRTSRHGVQFFSVVMILVACTGIFLPLEVALNQAWGVVKSRNYLANQAVAFGLAILMLALGIGAIYVTAASSSALGALLLGQSGWIGAASDISYKTLRFIVLAVSTGIASILFFFSIYWLLPNRRVPWRPVLRAATVTGLVWLVSKYAFVELLLPFLHLDELYGPFYVSVGLIFWSYTSGLILFAGAQLSVARLGPAAAGAKPEK
jgi:membrane protein